jgi:hypothetical protein
MDQLGGVMIANPLAVLSLAEGRSKEADMSRLQKMRGTMMVPG